LVGSQHAQRGGRRAPGAAHQVTGPDQIAAISEALLEL